MKVVLNVSVVNMKESAYETKLFVKLPEMVDFGRITSAHNEVIFVKNFSTYPFYVHFKTWLKLTGKIHIMTKNRN